MITYYFLNGPVIIKWPQVIINWPWYGASLRACPTPSPPTLHPSCPVTCRTLHFDLKSVTAVMLYATRGLDPKRPGSFLLPGPLWEKVWPCCWKGPVKGPGEALQPFEQRVKTKNATILDPPVQIEATSGGPCRDNGATSGGK